MAGMDASHVRLSKGLAWLLRHNIYSQGLSCAADGFVDVADVLALPRFRGFERADVERVVRLNDKRRFALRAHPDTGRLQIRANQGHTLQHIEPDLQPVTDAARYPTVVHGTYHRYWDAIRRSGGLSRMRRNHIHCAPGRPHQAGVISGWRANCDLYIYVDLARALQAGIPFFTSANGVILCPGQGDTGLLPERFFERVVHRRSSGEEFELELN